MMKDVSPLAHWQAVKVGRKGKDREAWTVHNAFHWSREIDGKRLDYWPSKRKWQFDGRISKGSITGFLKRHKVG